MIKQQLRTNNVLDQKILSLYDEFSREAFVPDAFKSFAYSDMQLKLDHNQRMMTPLEEALLLQSLSLNGHETILEIGTGSGFLTALLSRLGSHVTSIDCYPDFTTQAQKRLQDHQCHNVDLLTGNAALGWLDKAPYDVIIITGALPALPESLQLQVHTGGKLFAIIGDSPVMQGQLYHLNNVGIWHERLIFETNLPELINPQKQNDFVF